uniref:Ubiquitin-like protease family profile domain-containing protein n=1 Tax=Cucumis melo TaxID=3656 RepID=A0A9I9EIG1_CUCME
MEVYQFLNAQHYEYLFMCTFCGLATLILVNEVHQLDLQSLLDWVVFRQAGLECGFQGRTNKLVDGCYSFWQFNLMLEKALLLMIYQLMSSVTHLVLQIAKHKFGTIQFQKYFFAPSINCSSKQRLDISLRANTVYALNSLRHGSVRDKLKSMVNTGLRMFYAEINTRARPLTWVSVKCAQQPGSAECGYYVMKFMQDIVRQKSITITDVNFLYCLRSISFLDGKNTSKSSFLMANTIAKNIEVPFLDGQYHQERTFDDMF